MLYVLFHLYRYGNMDYIYALVAFIGTFEKPELLENLEKPE